MTSSTQAAILLIEDSPLLRSALVEVLSATGCGQVEAMADTAQDAIEALDARAFDIVIVDLQLREGSGIEVLAYLQRRALTDSMLVVVLTNHTLPAYRERCAEYGVRHFFDKSLEFDRVIDLLEDHASSP